MLIITNRHDESWTAYAPLNRWIGEVHNVSWMRLTTLDFDKLSRKRCLTVNCDYDGEGNLYSLGYIGLLSKFGRWCDFYQPSGDFFLTIMDSYSDFVFDSREGVIDKIMKCSPNYKILPTGRNDRFALSEEGTYIDYMIFPRLIRRAKHCIS